MYKRQALHLFGVLRQLGYLEPHALELVRFTHGHLAGDLHAEEESQVDAADLVVLLVYDAERREGNDVLHGNLFGLSLIHI